MTAVLHITRDFPPGGVGGISTAVGGMVRASARAGLRLAVISFDRWRPRRRRGADPPRLARADETVDKCDDTLRRAQGERRESFEIGLQVLRISSVEHLPAAVDFAAGFRPDLLHVHHGMLWELAAELRERFGVPALKTAHVVQQAMNDLRGLREPTLSLTAQRTACSAADLVTVSSHAAAAALLSAMPRVAARLRVVPHGVDDSARARAAAAQRSETARGPILYAGRFDDVKGTPELFAAMHIALREAPDLRFAIAGGIPDNPRAERRWKRQWQESAPADLRARVRFLGWLTPEALAEAYGEAFAAVVPSRFETFGLAAAEAMLQGLPVCAARAGALDELIQDGITGLLSPPGDAGALARNVLELWTQPRAALRLGANAAAEIRRANLWDHALPRLLDAIGELSPSKVAADQNPAVPQRRSH